MGGDPVARRNFPPRKRRTRGHVIAAQSVNYVERFILDEGHTAQRVESDYGYDLVMMTYDTEGCPEPGLVYLQLKASETLPRSGTDYVCDVDLRDWNLWVHEPMPVFLVLFDASRRRAYWLNVQRYPREAPARRPREGVKTVRVRGRQAFNRRAVARMQMAKQEVLDRFAEEEERRG
jgi:uncharacterized protein DUF4365